MLLFIVIEQFSETNERRQTWNEAFELFDMSMLFIEAAARTGTVLFSTTILKPVETFAMWRAHDSTYFKSAALPLPNP